MVNGYGKNEGEGWGINQGMIQLSFDLREGWKVMGVFLVFACSSRIRKEHIMAAV